MVDMTSWIRVPPRRKEEEVEKTYFHLLSNEEPMGQLMELLNSYMYAQNQGAPLRALDNTNASSTMTGLFVTTLKDCSGLTFVESRGAGSQSLNNRINLLTPFLASQPVDAFRAAAEKLFQLNSRTVEQISEVQNSLRFQSATRNGPVQIHKGVTPRFDVGLYIQETIKGRTPVLPYVAALREIQRKSKAAALSVFVVSDDESVLLELKRSGDASWTFYMYPPRPVATGGTTRALQRAKEAAFVQMLAEFAVLQMIPSLVTSLRAPAGKFLYLTCVNPAGVKGIDEDVFSPF
jgi:hypothetical protein